MKKKFIVGLLILLCGILPVKADNTIILECEYIQDSNGISLKIIRNKGESFNVKQAGSYGASDDGSLMTVTSCPSNVYYKCSTTDKKCIFSSTNANLSLSNANISGGLSLKTNSNSGSNTGISSWFDGKQSVNGCSGYFGYANDPNSLMHLLKYNIFRPIKYAVPIILVLFTTLDFSKVIFSDEKDGLGKAKTKFAKRAVMAVVIFFIPYILQLILTLVDDSVISSCLSNF